MEIPEEPAKYGTFERAFERGIEAALEMHAAPPHFCDLPLTACRRPRTRPPGVSKPLPWQCDVCGNVWKWHTRHVGKHVITGWDLRWEGFVDWHTRKLLNMADVAAMEARNAEIRREHDEIRRVVQEREAELKEQQL
jgi:hypothetical protein